MAVHLTLCFDKYGFANSVDDYNRLRMDPDPATFDRIQGLDVQELSGGCVFYEYGDEGRLETTVDGYDRGLTYVTAGELAAVRQSFPTAWNAAVFEFVRALPAETRVVLFWD